MAAKKAASKKAAKKKNGTRKPKGVSVKKNGKVYYGIIAQRILAKRAAAAKKRANSSAKAKPAKKKNTAAKAKVKPIVRKRANTAKPKATSKAVKATPRKRALNPKRKAAVTPKRKRNSVGGLGLSATVLNKIKALTQSKNPSKAKAATTLLRSLVSKAKPGAKAPAKRKSNPPRRHNSAEDVHEMFLGRPVEFEYEVEAPTNTPTDLAKLGVLTRLVILDKDDPRTMIELTFDDVAQMAPDLCADGRGNLHVVGGTYRIEPKGVWGEIEKIGYLAAKDHLDGKEYEWIHTFGEEGGTRPRFKADDEGFIHFVGGDYTLEAAGIRD